MIRKILIVLLSIFFILFCVEAKDDRGIGGTGLPVISEGDRGIGGTGLPVISEGDRGIGGTGVIGTITEFGSIWVNDLEIELDVNTHIIINGQPASADQLRLGQQVAVLAYQVDNIWLADQIEVSNVLIGKVMQTTSDSFVVNGITVKKDAKAPGRWQMLKVGQNISVSGYYDGNTVYATDVFINLNDDENSQTIVPVVKNSQGVLSVEGSSLKLEKEMNLEDGDFLLIEKVGSTSSYRKLALPYEHQVDRYSIEKRTANGERNVQWFNSTLDSKTKDSDAKDTNKSRHLLLNNRLNLNDQLSKNRQAANSGLSTTSSSHQNSSSSNASEQSNRGGGNGSNDRGNNQGGGKNNTSHH